MNFRQYQIRKENYDDDINPDEECAIEANSFSIKAIPLIIKDDLDGFVELVSSPEFNYDGSYPHARDRMYLSNYLYQPFFDELTGPSALCFAAFFNAEKIVEFILGLPDVDKTDAFHFACAGGSFNVMRTLFDQSECDLINKDSVRPLNIASYFGNVDVVKYLWGHGCPIISPQDTYSSVNKAAFNGNINVLEFFKEVDPNLLKKSKDYKHPIISAAIGGQPDCINYFIKLGDLNKSTISAALMEACKKGSLACVKILATAYINYKPNNKNGDGKQKSLKKSTRKKNLDDDFLPNKQNGRKKKNKNKNDEDYSDYDDEDNGDYEEEDEDEKLVKDSENKNCLPINLYMTAIKKRHIDILQYLFTIYTPESLDELFLCAIDQINFSKYIKAINYGGSIILFPNQKLEDENENAKKEWIQQSLSAFKIAKFILSNSKSKIFTDSFFDILTTSDIIENAICFLDHINFKIINAEILTESQFNFFKRVILNANSGTIPLINRILNDTDIDFFESKKYENLIAKSTDFDQVPSRKKKYEDINSDEYQEELNLMNDFNFYLSIISGNRHIFKTESVLFLYEKKFPFNIILSKKIKSINNFGFLMFPIFEANIKLKKYDIAKSFLKLIPSPQIYLALQSLFENARELFNKKEDEISEEKKHNYEGHLNYEGSAFQYIYSFNQKISEESKNEDMLKIKFNLFEYQCQDEEEMSIYKQIMEMIKIIIKMSSTEPQIAILLCENGLNKKWIIDQMEENDENEIIANDSNYYKRTSIHKNFENNSINPLINLVVANNRGYYFPVAERTTGILKYYIYYGIDVSQGTEYAKILWKFIIDHENGCFARTLIQNGNADQELRLLDDSVSLLDYAIQVKSVSICYIFFTEKFYSSSSKVIQDPNSILNIIEKEKVNKKQQPNLKEKNLKIMALIYNFLKFDYDAKKKNKLYSDLKKSIKPSLSYGYF